jgi:hypothetical protein
MSYFTVPPKGDISGFRLCEFPPIVEKICGVCEKDITDDGFVLDQNNAPVHLACATCEFCRDFPHVFNVVNNRIVHDACSALDEDYADVVGDAAGVQSGGDRNHPIRAPSDDSEPEANSCSFCQKPCGSAVFHPTCGCAICKESITAEQAIDIGGSWVHRGCANCGICGLYNPPNAKIQEDKITHKACVPNNLCVVCREPYLRSLSTNDVQLRSADGVRRNMGNAAAHTSCIRNCSVCKADMNYQVEFVPVGNRYVPRCLHHKCRVSGCPFEASRDDLRECFQHKMDETKKDISYLKQCYVCYMMYGPESVVLVAHPDQPDFERQHWTHVQCAHVTERDHTQQWYVQCSLDRIAISGEVTKNRRPAIAEFNVRNIVTLRPVQTGNHIIYQAYGEVFDQSGTKLFLGMKDCAYCKAELYLDQLAVALHPDSDNPAEQHQVHRFCADQIVMSAVPGELKCPCINDHTQKSCGEAISQPNRIPISIEPEVNVCTVCNEPCGSATYHPICHCAICDDPITADTATDIGGLWVHKDPCSKCTVCGVLVNAGATIQETKEGPVIQHSPCVQKGHCRICRKMVASNQFNSVHPECCRKCEACKEPIRAFPDSHLVVDQHRYAVRHREEQCHTVENNQRCKKLVASWSLNMCNDHAPGAIPNDNRAVYKCGFCDTPFQRNDVLFVPHPTETDQRRQHPIHENEVNQLARRNCPTCQTVLVAASQMQARPVQFNDRIEYVSLSMAYTCSICSGGITANQLVVALHPTQTNQLHQHLAHRFCAERRAQEAGSTTFHCPQCQNQTQLPNRIPVPL